MQAPLNAKKHICTQSTVNRAGMHHHSLRVRRA